MKEIAWPVKTRELQNHLFDSTVWNEFRFRDGDIVIATYGKTGTTWLQQIVCQLLFDGTEEILIHDASPWLDLRIPPADVKLAALEAQTQRRFIKTHLPVDALVYSPRAKYLYVGRDGRDVAWSLYNHHANLNDLFYQLINDQPGPIAPPLARPAGSVGDYFLDWLERDGGLYPFLPFWDHVRSWWDIRDLPNLLLLHYNRLKADLPGEIRRIATFLDIAIDETRLPAIVEHCEFRYMKANADRFVPRGGVHFDGGAQTFINKGTNGRWRGVLGAADSARYEAMARRNLGQDCAEWLAGEPA